MGLRLRANKSLGEPKGRELLAYARLAIEQIRMMHVPARQRSFEHTTGDGLAAQGLKKRTHDLLPLAS
jgi:hypothetical protein